jgi:hypothetical protein
MDATVSADLVATAIRATLKQGSTQLSDDDRDIANATLRIFLWNILDALPPSSPERVSLAVLHVAVGGIASAAPANDPH